MLTSLAASGASAHDAPKGIDLVWADAVSDAAPLIVTNRGLVFADPVEGGTPVDGGTLYSLRCNEGYGASTSDQPGVFLDESGDITIGGFYDAVDETSVVAINSDRACSKQHGSGLPDESLGRVVQLPGRGQMLVVTRTFKGDSAVLASDDRGRSWSKSFQNPVDQYYDSLLVAPSDPQRVYASGQRADRVNQKLVHLCAVSSNGGVDWQDQILPSKIIPFAVHPNDADVVFAYEAIDNLELQFRVLRSTDGGASFALVPELDDVRQPTSLSASGGALWLGIGGDGGLYRSQDDGEHFERVHAESVQSVTCLIERQGRLWMCANMAPNTNGVWYSDDDGDSFHKLLTFDEVTQPVMCDDLEAQVACSRAWYDYDIELHPPLPDAGAGEELDGGPDGSSGADGSIDTPEPSAEAGVTPRKRSSGCQAGERPAGGAGAWWLGLAVLGLATAQRLRRARAGGGSARG